MELRILCTRSIFTVIILLLYPCLASGDPVVSMYQEDEGPRSVGTSVTLKSEIFDNSDTVASNESVLVSLVAQFFETEQKQVGTIDYYDWANDTDYRVDYTNDTIWQNLSLSFTSGQNHMKIITWFFAYLPENYNNLTLITRAYFTSSTPFNNTRLYVKTCDIPTIKSTADQVSTFNITSNSSGHYKDVGICRCAFGYEPFHPDGSQPNTTAICEYNASWSGCTNLECWKGPQNITVQQTKYVVSESNAFSCHFVPGFPEDAELQLKIGYMTFKLDYTLQSSDNGKNVSCQVITEYTTAKDENATSTNVETVIVYYPPENSEVSQNDIVMLVNQSKVVNFSFSSNPRPGSGGISVNFSAELGKILPSYEWGKNSSDGSLYNYELKINWSSDADYGVFNVCAESFNPIGEDCSPLTIRNIPATTMVTTYTTPLFSDTAIESTDKAPNEEQNIGIIVGAAVAGIVALLLIIAVIYFVRRKRGKNSSNKKEERINEIYESTPNPGPSTETVYTVAGNSQAEMKTNEMYEASPQQPEIQDVYTTVNRDNKLKGKKDSSENPGTDSTSAETNGPAVADVYAMVKK